MADNQLHLLHMILAAGVGPETEQPQKQQENMPPRTDAKHQSPVGFDQH